MRALIKFQKCSVFADLCDVCVRAVILDLNGDLLVIPSDFEAVDLPLA